MASPMFMKVVTSLAMMMCMVLGAIPFAYGAIPCGQVELTVSPCLGYIRGLGGPVPPPCCNTLRTLNNQAKSTPDRQGVCRCFKSVAQTIPGINFGIVGGIPRKCGINLPYKISPSIDCNTYV
ncbi:hypothetical protein RIF29_00142 [Crotalaria pallida]|uniref:Non-specific lipid-transfer protein n=1 Tax=Crotalaria pallida TaxID=3830 RepID=A0AAN9IVU2_CROPI